MNIVNYASSSKRQEEAEQFKLKVMLLKSHDLSIPWDSMKQVLTSTLGQSQNSFNLERLLYVAKGSPKGIIKKRGATLY